MAAIQKHSFSGYNKAILRAIRDAEKQGKQVREVIVRPDVEVVANPKKGAASRKKLRSSDVKRKSSRRRNAYGLDRFFGRKPRVTKETWQFAGDSRRARALSKAGVSKKLMPHYTTMDWKELQGLDPAFVKKVMRGMNPRRISSKLRSAISSKIRQLRSEGMPQKQAVAAALREARSGYLKPKGTYRRSKRRNPESDSMQRAGQTYAMFHGRGPSEVLKGNAMVKKFSPGDVAALGDLVSLSVGDNAYQVQWGAKERPLLATDRCAKQLFIVGGNQALDGMMSGMKLRPGGDMVDLGEVNQIEYLTEKRFDGFQPIIYFHQFGEEDAKRNPNKVRRPRLRYSRKSKKLMLVGGAYKIKKDGIIN